jgi:putative hydrolase of the HAD superfamily
MKQIKAVLLDLDNTLIDFMNMKREATRSAIRAMIKAGLKVDENEGYKKLFLIYIHLGIESQNAFQEYLKKEVGRIDEKMLAAAINAYLKTKDSFMRPYPSVKPTLRELKKRKIRLAIVSDAPKVKVYQRLLAMGIEKYFDFVIGFEDTGKRKKTEIPLKMALERLNLNSGEVMMVGDSIKRDVTPSRKLEIASVWAKYGSIEKVDKIKPDFELDDFSEILRIV